MSKFSIWCHNPKDTQWCFVNMRKTYQILFKQRSTIMDKFLEDDTCIERLKDDYNKHKNLIIALDFDCTIYDYHNEGLRFDWVIDLIKECNQLGLTVVIFTANKDHKLVEAHCKEIGIEIAGINKHVLPGFDETGKIYYNILLDDRSGLSASYSILYRVVRYIQRKTKEV